MWILYAFASAFFAGVTAVLAKLGMEGVNSHLATALRTIVVALFGWAMVWVAGSSGAVGRLNRGAGCFSSCPVWPPRELAVLFSGAPAWGGQPGGPRG